MVIRNLHCYTHHLLTALLVFTLFHSAQSIHSQCTSPITKNPPEFEAATIKPSPDRTDIVMVYGVYTYPAGRVAIGHLTLFDLIQYAFGLQEYQIEGGPSWIRKERYDINAIPPNSSPSKRLSPISPNVPPNQEQCEMLRQLVIQRFSLKFHRTSKEGPVYWLIKGKKKLPLMPPKKNTATPFAAIYSSADSGNSGEVLGINTSISLLAERLSEVLGRLVIDKTSIDGSYDFHVYSPDQSSSDIAYVARDGIRQLGLQLQPARGTVESLVIDSAAILTNE